MCIRDRRETDRQTDRQTDGQTDRQRATDRQRQTDREGEYAHKEGTAADLVKTDLMSFSAFIIGSCLVGGAQTPCQYRAPLPRNFFFLDPRLLHAF